MLHKIIWVLFAISVTPIVVLGFIFTLWYECFLVGGKEARRFIKLITLRR